MSRVLPFLLLFCLATTLTAQQRATKKQAEFTPGTIPIFVDSLRGEEPGAFPSRWDLVSSGLVEVMTMDDRPVIGFVERATITPLLDTKSYLPRHFTVAFDAYFHNVGNEAYYILFNGRELDIRFALAGIKYGGDLNRTARPRIAGWKRLSLSCNERALKAFLDGEQLLNFPAVEITPTSLGIRALSNNAAKGKYAVIRDVRVMEGGMPLYERFRTEGRFVTNRIQFASGKATLTENSRATIAEVATVLRAHPELRLIIEGHTDGDGSPETNRRLGENRAMAVKQALVSDGITADRLETISYGEDQPVAKNDTPAGKYENRRVVFLVRE
ncbi:MAG: OmpA family protein [Bacteroidota bacterium]